MKEDPIISQLAADLALVIAKNTASVIATRVKAALGNKNKDSQITHLSEIINDLVNDKNELIRISQAYEQELVAQSITDDDIKYIAENLIPVVEKLPLSKEQKSGIDAVKPILSKELLTIGQLLGFNYKRAIGEPLTLLLQKKIEAGIPANKEKTTDFNTAAMTIAMDEAACKRLEKLLGIKITE